MSTQDFRQFAIANLHREIVDFFHNDLELPLFDLASAEYLIEYLSGVTGISVDQFAANHAFTFNLFEGFGGEMWVKPAVNQTPVEQISGDSFLDMFYESPEVSAIEALNNAR